MLLPVRQDPVAIKFLAKNYNAKIVTDTRRSLVDIKTRQYSTKNNTILSLDWALQSMINIPDLLVNKCHKYLYGKDCRVCSCPPAQFQKHLLENLKSL